MPAPMPIPTALPSPVTMLPPPISSGAELVATDGRSLPLVGAALTGEACGGVARLVLEQRFENRYRETLHVTYRMPLPADGAVSAYEFRIAGRVVAGRVEKKAEAREQFERAYLQQQLLLCNGKVGQLAKRVGMERTHLYRKLRSLGVDFRNISED